MMDIETSQAKGRLRDGNATQQDRDRILYFLAESRWTPEQLNQHIRDVHNSMCDHCPERNNKPTKLDWNSIIKTILWIFAALVAVIMTLTKTSAPGV